MRQLKRIDLPGGVWVAVFSLVALVMCIHAYIAGKAIPSEFVTIYGLVLGTFAVSKTVQKLHE